MKNDSWEFPSSESPNCLSVNLRSILWGSVESYRPFLPGCLNWVARFQVGILTVRAICSRNMYIYIHIYIAHIYDGLSKCLFPVLLINRNSMRAALCLPLKNMTYLDDVKTWKFFVTFGNLSKTTGIGERTSVFIRCRWYYLLNCVSLCVCLSECNMLLDMPPDQRCFLTVSYQSVNMAVPLNGLRVDRGMYLQFSLARC